MAEKNASRLAVLAIAGSVAAVVFALVVTPFLTTTAQQPEGEQRRIVALDPRYDFKSGQMITRADHVKLGDMDPNSARWFLDPFGKTMEGTSTIGITPEPGMTLNGSEWSISEDVEAFELYTIIRLPDFLGGADDDVSSYRAYSAISISDQCISRYWSDEGRLRLENPCAGDLYRPWDGVAVAGPAAHGISGRGIISTGLFSALASLDLSVDSEGYITAKRPDTGYSGNGMPGEGRRLSLEDIENSGEKMLAAASKHAGYDLPFPPSISGKYYLSELRPAGGTWWLGEWRSDIPDASEAVYSSYPSAPGSWYEELVVTSYPLKKFPELALNSPAMVSRTVDPQALDLDGEAEKLNRTAVNSLIRVYDTDVEDMNVRATNEIGIFSVLFAPLEINDENREAVTGALVWKASDDGKDGQLVTVKAWHPLDMEELTVLARTIDDQ